MAAEERGPIMTVSAAIDAVAAGRQVDVGALRTAVRAHLDQWRAMQGDPAESANRVHADHFTGLMGRLLGVVDVLEAEGSAAARVAMREAMTFEIRQQLNDDEKET
jgi:hypothetical protein